MLALITGFTLCLALQPRGMTSFVLVAEIALLGVARFPGLNRRITRAINAQEQERLEWRKNALGKATVGFVLEALTDGYIIFNDLSTLSSRIDHIVIGPTGIFMIETKNWRGTIRPDGQGELLCNGKSTGQCEVKNLLASIASLTRKNQCPHAPRRFHPGNTCLPARTGGSPLGHLAQRPLPDRRQAP